MTRFLSTPLPFPFEPLAPRPGGVAGSLIAAVIPAPGIESALRALASPDVLLVTTGQQPGLFLGPLYTVHKALAAARLAQRLSSIWHRPVVPVFWVAGDDHDFAEAATASWLNAAGDLVTRVLRQRDGSAPLVPLYREPLGDDIVPALEALAVDLPVSEFRDATLGWLRRHYRAEQSIAAAYGGALAELLAPHGVLCLDSTHPEIKRAVAPTLLAALRGHSELTAGLADLDARLRAQGHDAGIAVGDDATLVMLEGRLGRDRLVAQPDGYVTRRSGERFSLADLEKIAAAEPTRLSANVLLRPVVESAVLPTVGYIAGPGELRYLRLTPPIYRQLAVHRQTPVPRWSGLVIENRVDRTLEKFAATIDELLAPPPGLEARVLRSQLPAEATTALSEFTTATEGSFDALATAAHEIDPTLDRTVQNFRNQALSVAADLEKKLVHHLRKRSETELNQIVRSRTALLPGGKPQERVVGISSFLSRYGPGFLTDLAAAMTPWADQALEGTARSA